MQNTQITGLEKEVDKLAAETDEIIRQAEKALEESAKETGSNNNLPATTAQLLPANLKKYVTPRYAGIAVISGITLYAFYDMFRNSESKKTK